MTASNNMTPPPELVSLWVALLENHSDEEVFTSIVKWGADQELEACCKVLEISDKNVRELLYSARRPKQLNLDELSDEELCETYLAAYYAETNRQGPHCQAMGLRAVLARWGNNNNTNVNV
jgi:hypothetical protein